MSTSEVRSKDATSDARLRKLEMKLELVALPVAKNLALELAPIRVSLIAAGLVDTPLPADLASSRTRSHGVP